MASTTQDELYKTFAAISAGQAPGLDQISNSIAGIIEQIGRSGANDAQSSSESNGQGAGRSVGDTVESIATTALKSGFGIVPMISELLGFFGGGGSPVPPPLTKYALPPSIDFQAAKTGSGVTATDYDQMGMPRSYSEPGTAAAGDNSSGAVVSVADAGSRQTPQITVNVQAMDARSFMDHSNEIAHAVRDAMLNLNAINDVVNDL